MSVVPAIAVVVAAWVLFAAVVALTAEAFSRWSERYPRSDTAYIFVAMGVALPFLGAVALLLAGAVMHVLGLEVRT